MNGRFFPLWAATLLVQKYQDAAAKTDVMFGGSPIHPQGIWSVSVISGTTG